MKKSLSTLSILVVSAILCSFTLVQGQKGTTEKSKREILQEEQLKKLLSKVGVNVVETSAASTQSQSYRQVKIRWADSASSSSNTEVRPSVSQGEQKPALSVSVVEDRKRPGTLPRHRSLELSPTHLFIAAVDDTNQLRWWSIVPDPRIVRGEFQASTGDLRSENYYLSNFTLPVAFPDDPRIANLRFYQPIWTGSNFDLKLLAVVPVQ